MKSLLSFSPPPNMGPADQLAYLVICGLKALVVLVFLFYVGAFIFHVFVALDKAWTKARDWFKTWGDPLQ